MTKTQTSELEAKIQAMSIGDVITVTDENERAAAFRCAMRAGFKIKTRQNIENGTFSVKRISKQ